MKIRNSILLSEIQIEKLNTIAETVGALSRTGSTAGKPSWRALVNELAAGRLRVATPGKTPPGGRKAKRPKKAWRGHAKYPARWWKPNENGEMTTSGVVESSGMTLEALTAGGLIFGGTDCAPPGDWTAWWSVEPNA